MTIVFKLTTNEMILNSTTNYWTPFKNPDIIIDIMIVMMTSMIE